MFVSNKGYLYNTQNLGTINSVAVTYSNGTSTSGKTGVYFGNSEQSTYTTTSNATIKGQSQTDTWTNSTSGYGYFQLSTSNKNVQITKIVITYTPSDTPQPTTVEAPTFGGVTNNATVTEDVALSMTTATDGASISYRTFNTTQNDIKTSDLTNIYSGSAVNFTENGDYIVYAAAYKDGKWSSISSITFTVNKSTTPPTPSGTIKFERITSLSDLEVGKRYIIVCGNKALSGTRSQYGITISNYSTELPSDTQVNIYTLGGTTDAYTFLTGTNYMANTGTSNATSLNHLANPDEADMAQWKVSFGTSNNAVIQCVHHFGTESGRYLRGNGTSDFRCYTGSSTGNDIYLYKEVEEEVTVDDLYLIGYGMKGTEGWNLTTAPKMTYSTSAGTYAVDVYFDKAQRGMFQFAKGLSSSNDNWNGLTGRLYPSTNGSNVSVDNYDMDGTVGLYFTDNSNMYSFELPAGLYTITANLGEWKTYVTQKPVTMTISPNTATFDDTKSVTLASNLTELGGKIYYTTDGSTPSATNGTEYSGTITLDATTTIKAIAVLNLIQSEVAEKTYTKKPAAPEITPPSCTFNEPLTVTITAESGATIYYTTDGSDPTKESTQYNGQFTVSATTTVKAIAYVGEAYSSVASATYTYSNVQPSTGDFVLVTDASQLVAGNEYIIMSSYEDDWEDIYNVAFGSISSSSGTSLSSGFTVNGNIGTSGSTISLADGSGVNVLTLGGTTGSWNLKQNDDKYIVLPPSDTKLSTNTSPCSLIITIGNDYAANIQNSATTDTRQLRYYITSDYFRNYLTSQGKTEDIYLYTRESNAVQPPVFTPAGGIYNVDVDVTISCPTGGATIYYTTDGSEPSATNGTPYTSEIIVSETTTIKAIAVKGDNSSSVVTAEYTIQKSTDIATVTLDYREPFTAGIGKFTVQNESGYSPVWSLDGNYGVKGTAYNANTNPTNNKATSRLVSPIIDMTDAVKPELTFSHQINSYFTDVTNQCQLFIRETSNGTSGTWVQLPITFSDPAAAGGWTNDVVDIDLTDVNGVSYAGKKVQISFLYTNPTAGSGAGTWEIQNFVVADNSEYKLVNNIAEFLALENGEKAKFKNPVTVLYDYAQNSSGSYHEYIWVKDESGYMQFYLLPTLNSSTESTLDAKAAYYENGDIIPAGFVVVKNYYENGKFVQAYSAEALEAGFQAATQKGLADPEYMDFDVLDALDASDTEDVATWCNHYITLEKIKLTSSNKNFNFKKNEDGTQNSCVGYNKYNGDGSLLKDGTTSADVIMPTDLTKFYDVKGIIQLWQGGWEFMPIEFTEWKEEEMTLRQLCQDGEVNKSYTISNNLLAVYAKDNMLWLKDDTGQSIQMTKPASGELNYPINEADNTRKNQAYYDQSNWLQVKFADAEIREGFKPEKYVGKIINGGAIKGKFTDKLNPTLTDATALTNDDIYAEGSYDNNFYCMANFAAWQDGADHLYQTAAVGVSAGNNFFFMNPKPQEYATIAYAVWMGNDTFVIPAANGGENGNDFNGAITVAWDYNVGASAIDLDNAGKGNQVYKFNAIIKKEAPASGAPRRVAGKDGQSASGYVVYPTNLTAGGTSIITAVDELQSGKAVDGVRYVNVAGQVAATPWQGVNIVVTRYSDGSTRTTKVVK